LEHVAQNRKLSRKVPKILATLFIAKQDEIGSHESGKGMLGWPCQIGAWADTVKVINWCFALVPFRILRARPRNVIQGMMIPPIVIMVSVDRRVDPRFSIFVHFQVHVTSLSRGGSRY
jgi:hypothetical protein